ncbi:PucR family transcriptional regulator [Kribbella antibiotica]|uniref:PucR family transcriptional regulator n=1 Tax=Kribbella antibiotica TaxID=190195 RepID=A0A4V2YQM4_9ACTN|nr:helix-turn-helix domain-containing protein [Kribbella antibiotica]TDD62637.1 PucR family transcriptional regulator [Kribbella antibiotica]
MEPEHVLQGAIDQMTEHLDEIAALVIARSAERIPAYHRLPTSVLEGDLVANAKDLIGLFLRSIKEGRTPSEEELQQPVAWGAERARDGLPLDAVLRIYPIGVREAWAYAAEHALPPQDPEIVAFVDHLLALLGSVQPLVAAAYLREQQELAWEKREGRQNLVARLLEGLPADRLAARVGTRLADQYAVVAYRLPDLQRGATATVRAIQSALDEQPEVMWTFDHDLGILLVPDASQVPDVLGRVDTAAGAGTTRLAAAAIAAIAADIPRARREAVDLLQLAERLNRPAGLFWLPDLAIEYQLSQPGPARDYLAGLIAPLAGHPHLVDALRAFVATGYNRAEAAEALTIHRNTLNYRLGRIHTITGHDPTHPTAAGTLAAALIAHDLSPSLQ